MQYSWRQPVVLINAGNWTFKRNLKETKHFNKCPEILQTKLQLVHRLHTVLAQWRQNSSRNSKSLHIWFYSRAKQRTRLTLSKSTNSHSEQMLNQKLHWKVICFKRWSFTTCWLVANLSRFGETKNFVILVVNDNTQICKRPEKVHVNTSGHIPYLSDVYNIGQPHKPGCYGQRYCLLWHMEQWRTAQASGRRYTSVSCRKLWWSQHCSNQVIGLWLRSDIAVGLSREWVGGCKSIQSVETAELWGWSDGRRQRRTI